MISTHASILLLEKTGYHSHSMKEQLAASGFSVMASTDVDESRSLFESYTFDGIVADVLMTRTSDLDFITWARQRRPLVRIAVVSDFDSSFLAKQVYNRGADLFLTRPVAYRDLTQFLAEPRVTSSFSGTMRDVSLASYLEFMLMTGKKMVIEVCDNQGLLGRIFVYRGEVPHAVCGDSVGEEALHRCLSCSGGRVSNLPWCNPDEITITKTGQLLLMETEWRRKQSQGYLRASVS